MEPSCLAIAIDLVAPRSTWLARMSRMEIGGLWRERSLAIILAAGARTRRELIASAIAIARYGLYTEYCALFSVRFDSHLVVVRERNKGRRRTFAGSRNGVSVTATERTGLSVQPRCNTVEITVNNRPKRNFPQEYLFIPKHRVSRVAPLFFPSSGKIRYANGIFSFRTAVKIRLSKEA